MAKGMGTKVLIGAVVLGAVGVGIYFFTRKKDSGGGDVSYGTESMYRPFAPTRRRTTLPVKTVAEAQKFSNTPFSFIKTTVEA